MACVKRFMNGGYQQTMTVLFHSFHLESIHTADLPGDIDIVCFYHQVKSGLDASTIHHLVHSGLVHAYLCGNPYITRCINVNRFA